MIEVRAWHGEDLYYGQGAGHDKTSLVWPQRQELRVLYGA